MHKYTSKHYLIHPRRYDSVRRNISDKYAEIEQQLVDEFIEAHRSLDVKRMKQYAGALQPFPYVSTTERSSSLVPRFLFWKSLGMRLRAAPCCECTMERSSALASFPGSSSASAWE
jgi:hypothetical protein